MVMKLPSTLGDHHMKSILVFLLMCPLLSFAQESSTPFLEDMLDRSKEDLQNIIGPESQDMVPISAEVKQGKMYVMWGYHRGFHSRSDVTFKTPDGTFTLHNVRGVDRPSTALSSYIDPTKITVPQYNIRFGYMITDKVAIEVGTDHMKWVMDMSENYEISGSYDRRFWHGSTSYSLEELQQAGFNPPIHLEHTDGYNYPNIGVVYYQNLFTTMNKRWSAELGAGAGAGVLVTKTNIYIADGLDGSVRHNDNNFKLAGLGAHVDARLKISYHTQSGKQFFLMASARGVVGKVSNAPFLDNYGGSIEHSPIYSLQTGIMGGVSIPVFEGKKKKKMAR
jgi:hypothetical protein